METAHTIPLAIAAQKLRRSWHSAWGLVLRGTLRGVQDERGRWFVDAGDVERLIEAKNSAAGPSASELGAPARL